MAKQKGIHQLKGKVGGMSYYGQKGVEGGLARSINSGLSDRVKTDEAYANTRLNAAEFGTAGSFAGACIRSISERKRAMMKDFASGDLAKVAKSIVTADGVNDWGSRSFAGTDFQSVVREKLNQYAKLQWGTYIGGNVAFSGEKGDDSFNSVTTVNAPAGWGSLLAAKGAEGVIFDSFFGFLRTDTDSAAPFRTTPYIYPAATIDTAIGAEITDTVSVFIPGLDMFPDASNIITLGILVAKPYKVIAGKKYVLQELCTYVVEQVNVE